MKTFYVNKSSGTAADTQLTLGWSELLRQTLHALGRRNEQLLIHNRGESFTIELSGDIREEELICDVPLPFLRPFVSTKQAERQEKKGRTLQDGFDYDFEREKQKQLIAKIRELPAELRTPEARLRRAPELEAMLKQGPHSELPLYQAISALKVADTFNAMVLRWQTLTPEQQWSTVRLLYRLFSQADNDIEAAIGEWEHLAKDQGIESKARMTAVQIINPTTGKGANSPKGNRLSVGGMDSFWLLELLKFKGFMLGAAPYLLRGSKDRKTYVIQPETIELGTLARMVEQFRSICWSNTAVKQDIMASLRLAQVLVHHRRTALTSRDGLEEWEDSPIVSLAHGFDVTFYKDMGSAHAAMNVSTINVPDWFPAVTTLEQVDAAELFLQEHMRIIRRIEDSQGKEGSDELTLLRAYRDFLSGHDLRPFWTFAALYGCYLLRQRDREKNVKRWLPQLTQKGLDSMSHQNTPLRDIITTPGFQNIASAIREATVRAQRRRSQENDNTYEVRYGLGQELLRKARRREDFMIALSEFLAIYNAETAREEEKAARKKAGALSPEDYRKHKLRRLVSTTDIEQFTSLLDKCSTELVATMLIAYGYSRWEPFRADEIQTDLEDTHLEDNENN